ncbi:MAG: hypothetical protein V4494_06150 [Chlamydiota bacterium]
MISIKQETLLGTGLQQRLQLSFAMHQAFQILQMPTTELSSWLKEEIEENPCLEYEEAPSFFPERSLKKEKAFSNGDSAFTPSLFEYVMEQAHLSLETEEELKIAEHLAGSLDHRGFLMASDVLAHMEQVLEKMQLFDPPGIAARSLRESLLIQLRHKHLKNSLSYEIINLHYEDLLHNRLLQIAKKTKRSVMEVKQAIEEKIAPLNLRPAAGFFSEWVAPIIPDMILTYEDEKWNIEPNEACFPLFQINNEAMQDRYYLERARWIKKAIMNRQKTLLSICRYFIKKQGNYLSGDTSTLKPMTMQEVAEALNVHISTIGRAVNDKHLLCPRGTVAMRSLFSYDLGNATSNHSVKQLLTNLIKKENKENPLSDEALALKILTDSVCA